MVNQSVGIKHEAPHAIIPTPQPIPTTPRMHLHHSGGNQAKAEHFEAK